MLVTKQVQDKDNSKQGEEIISEAGAADELAKVIAQLEMEKEAKLRALADLDNYRKRVEKERAELITSANMSILRAIIDVIDDFERMVEDLEQPGKEDPIDAFAGVLGKTKGILKDYSVSEVSASIGDKLDPSFMEAIGTVASEPDMAGKIVHIAQKGYKYDKNGMVIRPVRVIVGIVAKN